MKIEIEISADDARRIITLLERMGEDDCNNSHGKLTMKTLAEMLMQDVALAERRPGSWEGHNMIQVLTSHGYMV